MEEKYLIGFKSEKEADEYRHEMFKKQRGSNYDPNNVTKYLEEQYKHPKRDEWAIKVSMQNQKYLLEGDVNNLLEVGALIADGWFDLEENTEN